MEQENDRPGLDESIGLIEQFMLKSREDFKQQGFILIFWGVLISVCCVADYMLMVWFKYSRHYLIWPVLTISGSIYTMVYYAILRRPAVTGFSDGFLRYLFGGSAITYFTIAFFCVYNQQPVMPFMLAITGLLVFVTGGTVRFGPLLWGSLILEAASISALFMSHQNQLLVSFIAMVVGYVLPGYLLSKKN